MSDPHTRIVCTVGPSCRAPATLAAMARAGADVFRINGAHVAPEEVARWVRRIRRAGAAADKTVATLLDLPGTKIRTGRFRDPAGVELVAGAPVRLYRGAGGGTPTRIPVRSLDSFTGVGPGRHVLLDDGRLRLRVTSRVRGELRARVEVGGTLRAGKGVHVPGAPLQTTVPTRSDLRLARAGVDAGIDWIGLSFVRAADDVERLRGALRRHGSGDVPIAAKIERRDAVDALDEILAVADAVVVARGDLGVDVGAEYVPSIQMRILEAALRAGRPAIVATEMLDSMTHRMRPTRAEASDVAGAVFEGTDAVLLSAETAVGDHPVLTVETMARILAAAERDPHSPYADDAVNAGPWVGPDLPDQHVVRAAVDLAFGTAARAIVVFTRTGASAIRVSKERPRARIHAYATSDAVCRRLALAWGVWPRRLPAGRSTDAIIAQVTEQLRRTERLKRGDHAVLVMGAARDPAGTTTMIKLLTM